MVEKSAQQKSKTSHFKVWKFGKRWFYSAIILTSLFAVGIGPSFISTTSFGQAVASAATVKTGTTILVNSYYMGGSQYLYIWDQDASSIVGQMTYAGNGYYAYTFSGTVPNNITLALSDTDGQTGSTWPSNWVNMPVADGAGNITGLSSAYHFVTVNGLSVQKEAAPTLAAVSGMIDGVSGTSYDLSAQSQPAYATNYETTALKKEGNLTYSVTDPNGVAVTMAGAIFVPKSAGVYIVTYTQSYRDIAERIYEVQTTQTLTVNNRIVRPVNSPNMTLGISTDLSATAMGVTDSDSSLIPMITSVTLNGQPISPDNNSLTHYTFNTSGTYSITYSDITGAFGTITGNVIAPIARTTVAHQANNCDTLAHDGAISLDGNVGDSVEIPAIKQVTGNNKTGYTLDKITFNGGIVQAGDKVTLKENNALIYHYTKNPVNTEISETKNVDVHGKPLTDTIGYEQVSSSVAPAVVKITNQYGDTTTTITTTNVWRLKDSLAVPVKELTNPNTQQAKAGIEASKKFPNAGEDSDVKLLGSGLTLVALLIGVLGGKMLKERKKDL
ncbi:hypothetical protein RyT2_02650 [Pseudolactococcus yaeyamensis]